MDKSPRKDKLKNISKVAPEILKNPLKTERDIEKETGVGKSTINRIKQELGQAGAKSEFVLEVLEKDKAIIKRWLQIIHDKLNDDEQVKTMRISEVSSVIRENTARYSMFAWTITDDEWWMKAPLDLTNASPEEVKAAIRSFL